MSIKKVILISVLVAAVVGGILWADVYFWPVPEGAGRDPLLWLPESRFYFCQDGKVFRELPSYPEGDKFYFLAKLDEGQLNRLKRLMGGYEISFSGSEYQLPEGMMPAGYPDFCMIEYHINRVTKNIDFGACTVMRDRAMSFVRTAGFNVRANYETIVQVSRNPVDDYDAQISVLCQMPLSNGRPVYGGIWRQGAERSTRPGYHIYDDIK